MDCAAGGECGLFALRCVRRGEDECGGGLTVEKQQNVREKLVELLQHDNCPLFMVFGDKVDVLADYLIANGVTVQDGNDDNVLTKWIPVTERLPEKGLRVLTTDGAFVGEMYLDERGQWRRYNVNSHELLMALDILYWMPMPEPPVGGFALLGC